MSGTATKTNPLIVPMCVEALVVNDSFRTNGDTFMRNQMAYNTMQHCSNGQPGINDNDTNFTLDPTCLVPPNNVYAGGYYNGVYLKWRLPKAFTKGVQDGVTGVTQYPLVPNRWLVVRYSGALASRQATAWIVESDYLYPGNQIPSAMNASEVACIFVKPNSKNMPEGVPMGCNVLLGSGGASWSESGHDLKLTAMAPGNPTFAVYQPQCNNVFSFIDNISGEAAFELSASSGTTANTVKFFGMSAVQVNWGTGSITVSGGMSYTISAGNTGTLSLPTYIYLDPSVSTTVLQITTTLATAQASGCTLIGTATPFSPETLSYMVCGWFSESANDPLAPGLATFDMNPNSTSAESLTFSAVSASQVDWAAGSITSGGMVYSITAGNTGAISVPTYVYLDPSVSATVLQTSTTIATAQASGCVLIATATPFFVAQLAALDWTLPQGTDSDLTASWSMLCGSVDGVQMQNTDCPPGGVPKPETGVPVSVAVGNSSVEALTAMITAQADEQNLPIDSELLEAFQLDLVDVFDKPDGAALLAEKLKTSFYQKHSGGYVWNIVDAPDSTKTISARELKAEQAWLATLNSNQQKLDAALQKLAELQAELYGLWWKYTSWLWAYQGSTTISGLSDQSKLKQQLDPTHTGSPAQLTKQQIATVQTLSSPTQVPGGDTPNELAQAIQAYSTAQNLPATRLLKRSAAPNFYLPNNPVVLIAGAGASGIKQSASAIQCRFSSQLVGGFKYSGQTISPETQGLSIPQPDLLQVTGAPWASDFMTELVQEFFFLDPNNATMASAAIAGSTVSAVKAAMADKDNDLPVYPVGAIQQWTKNPWHPLKLFWQTRYYPIEYGTAQSPNWAFDNGQYYWNGTQASVGRHSTQEGLIQLAPTANFNMVSRIKAFLKNTPDLNPLEKLELETLLSFVQKNDNWDVLSQSLDGFNNQLQLGMSGVFLSPDSTTLSTTPPLPSLIGNATGYPTALGNIPTGAPSASEFKPWRAGQFEFTQLVLIDEWGQALWPIDLYNYQQETVYVPADLSPVLTSTSAAFGVASEASIDSISPSLALSGGSAFTLTVNGINFVSGETVQWGGTPLNTTFVSASQLTASVSAAQIAAAGSIIITVSSGGHTSNSETFTIVSACAIDSLSPKLLQAGMASSSEFTITITGVGFTAGAIAKWNGTALNTELVSSTRLKATVPANFSFAPGSAAVTVTLGEGAGGTTTNSLPFTLTPEAAIVSLRPNQAVTGSAAFVLKVAGEGFEPTSMVQWSANGTHTALATTYVSHTELTALVTAQVISQSGTAEVTVSTGAKVLLNVPDSFIQLPPALLQPAKLNFELISNSDDSVVFGPASPTADPICGWVLPNHLDGSLMAYDASGVSLGEMSVDVSTSGTKEICWASTPGSPHTSLATIATAIPHFGDFLLTLSQQTPAIFKAFLKSIDETLWTTAPMGASFDQNLAVLIGRPLAMVRANLQFLLDGPPVTDPSWQYTFSPATADITSYEFAIELGNRVQLKDGLIGYFVEDQYGSFNVVTDAGATEGNYLKPIGEDNNYIYMPFDGATSTFISMLIDPYAAVHASTGILPVTSVSLPPQFTTNALAAMNVIFRVDGILTDQQNTKSGDTSILMPVPKEKSGQWTWLENNEDTWKTYDTAPNDTSARLSSVAPVLRRGFLKAPTSLDD